MSAPIITFEHVTKEYQLHAERTNLRSALPGRFGEPRRSDTFRALDDVSFEVERGEAIGIVGSNGAGKSTLLKALAGVVTPTTGRITRPRELVSIIELGLGFNPDLTGDENLRFGGALLGMSVDEIDERADEILAFAELQDFADMPVKRYSTGMLARLGFALATSKPADVFVVDEVLSVGDWSFQRKSLERMRSLNDAGSTMVFVSHNLWVVNQLCERSVLLDRGHVAAIGPTHLVLGSYLGQTPYLNDLAQSGGTDLEALGFEGDAEEAEPAGGVEAAPGPAAEPGEEATPASATPISPEALLEFEARMQAPIELRDVRFDPPAIQPGGATDLIGELVVHHVVPGARLLVGAYWEGFAGFSEPDELPGEILGEVGVHRFKVHYPMMACCPSTVSFQVAVVGAEEPDDPEQVLPNALVKARTDLKVLGKVTARPGVWLPREFSADPVDARVPELEARR